MSAEKFFEIAIQQRAVRKRLRKYLSRLDQSRFGLAFPEFALKNPITVFLEENWADETCAIEKLLLRSSDWKTELTLCDGEPTRDEGIKSFLTAFVRIPFVNVVSMDFSAQCLSSADYFTHLGSHRLPRLRRLSLRLYHVPDVTANVDAEVDCFPSLDEAEVCFFGRWCPGGFCAVIQRLRNTRQLALVDTNLWIHGQSCCIAKTQFSFNHLRILRTALTFLSPDNIYEGIQFPSLELVVLINHNLSPDMAKTGQYESYFPGVKVHFGLPKRRRDNDPKNCAAYYIQNSVDMALAIENPLETLESCPSGTGFMGCSEFNISGDRIVPLSLEEVNLLFILEPILDSLGVSLERNAIEEIILKADVRISRLRCELIAMEAHEVMRLRKGYGMVAMLKFLPILAAQKDTLTSLDIAAELLIGCLRIPEALRQIKSLRGQLVSMVELIANAVEDPSGAPFYNPTVRTADLRPFLEMCPSLVCLEIRIQRWCTKLNFAKLRRSCPCLKTLFCYSPNCVEDWMDGLTSPWRLQSFFWSFGAEFTVKHLYALAGCVQAPYILLCLYKRKFTVERKHVRTVFARMPCLRWLVLTFWKRAWICSRDPDSQTVQIVSTKTASWEDLCGRFPQLFGKLWSRHMACTHNSKQPCP